MQIEPVSLSGRHVRLEPLQEAHIPALTTAGAYQKLWRWMPFALESERQVREFVAGALKMAERRRALPFTLFAQTTGEVIGATGYWYIDRHHRRLEIGATWITPKWQRSAINTEAKYLMLKHTFEVFGCIRVEFRVDSLNEKSLAAVRRIGAQEEGVLRNHMILPDGRKRHSVCFGITDDDWPSVRTRLEALMATYEGVQCTPADAAARHG